MRLPVIAAVLFGVGVGLFFFGLSRQKRSNRFRKDLYQERRSQLLGILRPLLYTQLGKYLIGRQKSLSLAELEDLLARAGHPLGLKPRTVQLARILLSIASIILVTSLYGMRLLFQAAKNLFTVQGLQLTEARSNGVPVLVCLLLLVFAYYMPVYLLKYLAWVRDNKVKEEQGIFTETIFTLLRVNQPLRVAIEEAAKTAEFLKPNLQVCLNEWHTDRIKALQNLKRNVGVPRFDLVIDMLIQAATLGDEQTSDFLEENKKLEDELINISISVSSKMRPVLMTFQMLIPLAIVFLVLFYPAMTQVEKLLYSISW